MLCQMTLKQSITWPAGWGLKVERPEKQFLARYRQHAAAIREIYLRYVGRIEMKPT